MENSEIFYSLNIEDIQTVANDELGRDLTEDEIKLVIEEVCDNLGWYDTISNAIMNQIPE